MQKKAEDLREEMTASMNIAAESLKRAKLTQNKLCLEEQACVYRKIF